MRNLLDNAHRYAPEGARIAVRVARRGRLACLEVSDDGPGIPREQLPRVFDRLWRPAPTAVLRPAPGQLRPASRDGSPTHPMR